MRQILSKFTTSPYIHHFRFQFPLKSENIQKNLLKFDQVSSEAPALFLSFNGVLENPQVATTIRDTIKNTAAKKKLPVYSFLQDNINGLSYYVATAGKQIYANSFCLMGDLTVPTKSYTNIHKLLKFLGVEFQRIGKETKLWNAFSNPSQNQNQFTKNWLKIIQQKLKTTIVKQRSLQQQTIQLFGNKIIHPFKALQLKLIDRLITLEQYKQNHFPNNKLKLVNIGNNQTKVGFNQKELKVLIELSQWIQQPKAVLMAMQDPINQILKKFVEIVSLRLQDSQKLQQLQILARKLMQKIQINLENRQKLMV